MRLDKILRNAGFTSRKETREYVSQGRFTVNSVVVTDPSVQCDGEDQIAFDGKPVERQRPLYLMMHKPGGCICANHSDTDLTVLDLLGEEYRDKCLFPVGRLDKDTEGLLLLTNDGDFCREIIRPEKNIVKTYYTKVSGLLPPDAPECFQAGIVFPDGTRCLPGEIKILEGGKAAVVRISEGKTHQVKRMIAALGTRVSYLKRLSIGDLVLDEALPLGAYRKLTGEELARIFTKENSRKTETGDTL